MTDKKLPPFVEDMKQWRSHATMAMEYARISEEAAKAGWADIQRTYADKAMEEATQAANIEEKNPAAVKMVMMTIETPLSGVLTRDLSDAATRKHT